MKPEEPRRGHIVVALLQSVMLIGLLTTLGCAAAGVVAYKVAGPPKVPAQYYPPKVPTVILVENYQFPTATGNDSEQIGRYLYDELRSFDVVPLKSPDDLYALRSRDPIAYRKMTVGAIGKAVGADQVLYVNLTQSKVDLTQGTEMLKGHLAVMVKFVNVQTGATQWPLGSEDGQQESLETPYVDAKKGVTESELRQQMYHEIAVKISQLFYDWKPEYNETPDMTHPLNESH